MPHTKRIGRRYATLRQWREAKGLTQQEAAAYLGVATISYQSYELGRRRPRGAYLERIFEKTGVALEALVGVA